MKGISEEVTLSEGQHFRNLGAQERSGKPLPKRSFEEVRNIVLTSEVNQMGGHGVTLCATPGINLQNKSSKKLT